MESENEACIADKILFEIDSIEQISNDATRKRLMDLINTLIKKDFNALLQLLYRIDVDENKIRIYLNENKNLDAASILADLIIERQQQKIKSRQQFQTKNEIDDKDEKW